jgi:hypothetical protein
MKASTAAKGKAPNIGDTAPAGSTSIQESRTAPRLVLPANGTAVDQNVAARSRDELSAPPPTLVFPYRHCPQMEFFASD